MHFFKLTHPEYDTDHEESSRNPVTSTASYRLPGINCVACGTWSSSERLRVPLPQDTDAFSRIRFLGADEWESVSPQWAESIGISVDDLAPGAKLGPPQGVCVSEIQEDSVHPMPGEIWIVSRVKEAFIAAGLTGVSFERVKLTGNCGHAELWELIVQGRACRKGSTEGNLYACEHCRRRVFPRPKLLSVDESRWDGSDFVLLDHNPNIIVVTERTQEVLVANAFSNLAVESIE